MYQPELVDSESDSESLSDSEGIAIGRGEAGGFGDTVVEMRIILEWLNLLLIGLDDNKWVYIGMI